MEILVSGSLAYDRIMDFPGRFADHILPERIHMLNVSFTVNGLSENFGGTAGNIAYSLWLQGEKARIIAAIGQDYHRYFEWLAQLGLDTGGIRRAEGELTAGAYITTDADNNQITGFNPGAMKQQAGFDFSGIDPQDAIAIISPGNLADMQEFSARYHRQGIRAIFDPGQSLPLWGAEDLARCIRQSWARIFDNANLMQFNIRNLNVVVQGEFGCVTCVEGITSVVQGRAANFSTYATNIFARHPDGWRLIAHHASPGG